MNKTRASAFSEAAQPENCTWREILRVEFFVQDDDVKREQLTLVLIFVSINIDKFRFQWVFEEYAAS